jgi:acetyl esterase/lipase
MGKNQTFVCALMCVTVLSSLAACGGGNGSHVEPPAQANAETPAPIPPTPEPEPEPAPAPTPTPPPPSSPPPPIACSKTDVEISTSATQVAQCDSAQYDVLTNLGYASGGSHLFDLYKPRTATQPLPLVIWIHGGSWRYLDKSHMDAPRALICHGYAVASIDYRLTTEAVFPAQIRDVKTAIRHLRANASLYGLDPSRIAVFGSSAGGHLSALAGTSGGVADLEGLQMGNSTTSSRVQAVIDWFGHTDLEKLDAQLLGQGCPADTANRSQPDSLESKFLGCTLGDPACSAQVQRANPVTYASSDDPSYLIMHGTADCTVPRAQAVLLFEALKAHNACVSMYTLKDVGHSGDPWLTVEAQALVAAFLDETLGK